MSLLLSFMTDYAQTTPKSQLIYCSCAETPHGIPDDGKDYYELIADVGKTPKVVRCVDAGTDHEQKSEYDVTAEDVKRMQEVLYDLNVGKLKDYNKDDVIDQFVSMSTHDNLLVFTDTGRVFRIKGYNVPEFSRISKGIPVINLVSMNKTEKIRALVPYSKEQTAEYLFFSTKKGIIKMQHASLI